MGAGVAVVMGMDQTVISPFEALGALCLLRRDLFRGRGRSWANSERGIGSKERRSQGRMGKNWTAGRWNRGGLDPGLGGNKCLMSFDHLGVGRTLMMEARMRFREQEGAAGPEGIRCSGGCSLGGERGGERRVLTWRLVGGERRQDHE